MKIATYFMKEQETKLIYEVNFHDTKYITLDEINYRKIFRQFFRSLWFITFKKNKVPVNNVMTTLESNANEIYNRFNSINEKAGIPPINYQEFFEDFGIKQRPDYIQ